MSHTRHPQNLFPISPLLLARSFSSKRLLRSALVSRFKIKRVLLDVFDDVFLLNFPLETAQCALDRLTVLNFDFGHARRHPLTQGQ